MNVQLDDLIAIYPPVNSPGIQNIITNKREFSELASTPREKPPAQPGMFFKHQEFIGRLMVWLDRLLMIHQTGTGKTCSVVRLAEYYRRIRDSGGHIKRTYVLVKGPSLKREFKRQVLCTCTAGEYVTDLVRNATNEETRKSNITREIKKWYSIRTYTKFANKLAEPIYEEYITRKGRPKRRMVGIRPKISDEEIIRRYSNTIFFVDEVHNLRVDATTGEDVDKVRFVYQQLWRLFHLILRSKIILATATPMINDVSEIGPLMNMILPSGPNKEGQIPDDFDYNHATLVEMEPYFRGRISYVRALDTGAIPVYRGEPIMDPKTGKLLEYTIEEPTGVVRKVASQTIVYPSRMLRYVDPVTQRPMGQDVGYESASREATAEFHMPKRQASALVFPDNTYGERSFERYVFTRGGPVTTEPVVEGGKRKKPKPTDDYYASDELLPYLINNENLAFLACKFAVILEMCKNRPGNCFVYSDFVDIGAVLLGLSLEAQGFEKFTETQSIFRRTQGGEGLPEPCSSRDNRNREVRITAKPRYSLLTSRSPSARVDSMMEAFNSYENRHGDYIKVMVGSPVARDGINLANVLQVHIASAGWNPSSIYQAISRAIRATSHVDLLEENRVQQVDTRMKELTPEQLEQEIQNVLQEMPPDRREQRLRDPEADQKNLQDVRVAIGKTIVPSVTVDVYKHVAISQNNDSIDLRMYQLSEQKEIDIKRMERIMKQCSVDCQIHYQRNIRPNDINYSSTCDYDVCEYQCVDQIFGIPKPPELDESTFDVYYSDEIVNAAIDDIINIFKQKFTITTTELYALLQQQNPKYKPKFLDLALMRIIAQKRTLFDRFGYQSYLREDGDTLFLQRDYPIITTSQQRDKYALNMYAANLIANKVLPISDLLANLRVDEQADLVAEIKRLSPDNPRFGELIDQLNLENKVKLLEDSVYRSVSENAKDPYIKGVIDRFSNVLFSVNEPVTEIQKSIEAMATRGTGPGRKPKAETKLRVRKLAAGDLPEIVQETDTPLVYLHTLFSQMVGNVAYATTARYNKAEGRVRLFKPNEKAGWRDNNPYEFPVYNRIIQAEIAHRAEPFEQYDVYGILRPDKKFLIRYKGAEDATLAAKDQRLVNRGRDCMTWKKSELIDILWRLRVPPPPTVPLDVTDRDIIIAYLLRQGIDKGQDDLGDMDDEELQFYYRWYRSGAGKKAICNRIQEYMAQNDLLQTL